MVDKIVRSETSQSFLAEEKNEMTAGDLATKLMGLAVGMIDGEEKDGTPENGADLVRRMVGECATQVSSPTLTNFLKNFRKAGNQETE